MVNMGQNLGRGLWQTGDSPCLDRIEEPFAHAIPWLTDILADGLNNGEGIEFFIVIPQVPQYVHSLFGQGALR